MKHFRRSTKSSETRPGHTSVPAKSEVAWNAPKKVIKALHTLNNNNGDPHYMTFEKGEFLYVIGREDDPDWYEACNPATGKSGLVPVNHFELVEKQQGRTSGGVDSIMNANTTQVGGMTLVDRSVVASRQSMQNQQQGAQSGQTTPNGLSGSVADGMRMSKLGRSSGAMVYGVVQYDFHAERPDELDAKAGEAIIVIAQSNPEWFVAKPITRLGGPGLIPVSFIEIRDMGTGNAVADPQGAVQKAGVPKVEEWKRMAASYKNSSIPLGKLGSSNEGSARASVDSGVNGSGFGQQRYSSNGYPVDQQQSRQRYSHLAVPLQARVPRYCHHEARYWFIVEAHMDDGKKYELNREYTDFYALQTALMDAFPQEAGKIENSKRTLPYMPGPLPWVTERLTAERRDHMDRYVVRLLNLPSHISSAPVVRDFFAPREGDTLLDAENPSLNGDGMGQRWSDHSSRQSYPPDDSRQSSTGNLSYAGTSFTSPSKSAQHTQQAHSPTGYGSNMHAPLTANHQRAPSGANGQSMYTVNHGNGSGGSGTLIPPAEASSGAKDFVRVKVHMGHYDTLVLRLEKDYTYKQLLDKLYDRWPDENDARPRFYVWYKGDKEEQWHSISDDPSLSGDEVLQKARRENPKYVLKCTKPGV